MSVRYPVVKLLDYADRQEYLEKSDNRFALVTLAMLKSMKTRRNKKARLEWKTYLIELLYERGRTSSEAEELSLFIDCVMPLPSDMENASSPSWQKKKGIAK